MIRWIGIGLLIGAAAIVGFVGLAELIVHHPSGLDRRFG